MKDNFCLWQTLELKFAVAPEVDPRLVLNQVDQRFPGNTGTTKRIFPEVGFPNIDCLYAFLGKIVGKPDSDNRQFIPKTQASLALLVLRIRKQCKRKRYLELSRTIVLIRSEVWSASHIHLILLSTFHTISFFYL